MSKNRYICIHSHFYQPPRENPWLEDVELQDSAHPYHDWNERITEECYKANATSRILDKKGNITKIVNNYTQISFNFGPTLLAWLEKHQPGIYSTILEADKTSQKRFNGHGSAIAQSYNHMIMPLANRQDKLTQVWWGIRDFQKRFGRFPEGMWLPETAVNYETLEVLAESGIKYTILAPNQAAHIRKMGSDAPWQKIIGQNIDSRRAYHCSLSSGKSISIFFYNGPLAHDLSFGDLLKDGETFARRLVAEFSPNSETPELVNLATDGETFGHHHHFGEMALSYCLHHLEENKLAKITNYGEYLELNPPTYEVQIAENTSWSCLHGIERWRADCGCKTGGHHDWQQKWRKPLREALDWLRDEAIEVFQKGAALYFKDVWQVRNEYINLILNRTPEHIHDFLAKFARHILNTEETVRALKYLELERNAMLMYTSCGWFFDDISRIETIQNLRYAARVIQFINELDTISLEEEFLKKLELAPSNIPLYQNGAKIYQLFVKPVITDLPRVGAHYAITALFNDKLRKIYAYRILEDEIRRKENSPLQIILGSAKIKSEITLEQDRIAFAVLYLGSHNVNGRVKRYHDEESHQNMIQEISSSFQKADVVDIIRLMDKHFSTKGYSLLDLFKDEQREVMKRILEPIIDGIENNFDQIYLANRNIIGFLKQLDMPVPKNLTFIAEQATNQKLNSIFTKESIDLEKLNGLLQGIEDLSLELEKNIFQFKVTEWLNHAISEIKNKPFEFKKIQEIVNVLKLLSDFRIYPNIWEAQNTYFELRQELLPLLPEKIKLQDKDILLWQSSFQELATLLKIALP